MKIVLSTLCILGFTGFTQISFAKSAKPAKPSENSASKPPEYQRVDPHGKTKSILTQELILQEKACQVCHVSGLLHPPLKQASDSCLNCHNPQPHSGIIEHSKKDMTCTSCHSYHRADAISWHPPTERFLSFKVKTLAPGEVNKPSDHPMLKKTCTDCHKW